MKAARFLRLIDGGCLPPGVTIGQTAQVTVAHTLGGIGRGAP
ncbi:hypothetical protein SAMN04488504_109311 [Myxococcus virescens]|uniref:Uncharacterized protein n=1 Tax=Myxococcus virescens TaxID=83456 RepID=A0ABY0MX20_9BACT|nr:hypothetical protein SAMN04488504_109311 [Myxococcus virescens]